MSRDSLNLTDALFTDGVKASGMLNMRGQWRSSVYEKSEHLRLLAAGLAIEEKRKTLLNQKDISAKVIDDHIAGQERPNVRAWLKKQIPDGAGLLSTANQIAYIRQFEMNSGHTLSDSSIRYLNRYWELPLALQAGDQVEYLPSLYNTATGNPADMPVCHVTIKETAGHFHTRSPLATPGNYHSCAMHSILEVLAIMKTIRTMKIILRIESLDNRSEGLETLLEDFRERRERGSTDLLLAHINVLKERFKKGQLSWQSSYPKVTSEEWGDIHERRAFKGEYDAFLKTDVAVWRNALDLLEGISTDFDLMKGLGGPVRLEKVHVGLTVASFVLGAGCLGVPWVFFPSIVGMTYTPVFSGMPIGIAYASMIVGISLLVAGVALACALSPSPQGHRVRSKLGRFTLSQPVFELNNKSESLLR